LAIFGIDDTPDVPLHAIKALPTRPTPKPRLNPAVSPIHNFANPSPSAACPVASISLPSAPSEQFYTDAGKMNDVGCFRERIIRATWGCPMERFYSQQNIERYRKLLDIATDEPQRRLIFKLLAAHIHVRIYDID
jgi:hypothetical protein